MMNRNLLVVLTTALIAGCIDGGSEDFGGEDGVTERGLQFFSQRDPSWASDQLGYCDGETIQKSGCAVSAVAMAMTALGADVDPGSLNEFLIDNQGYDGCAIYWAKAADLDGAGGVQWIHAGVLGSPESLRAGLDQGKQVVVKSTRFQPNYTHWVYIAGYDGDGSQWSDFYYLDPYDKSPDYHQIGDGRVDPGALTRVYQ